MSAVNSRFINGQFFGSGFNRTFHAMRHSTSDLTVNNTVSSAMLRRLLDPSCCPDTWNMIVVDQISELPEDNVPCMLVIRPGNFRLSQELALTVLKSFDSFEASMGAAIIHNEGRPLQRKLRLGKVLKSLRNVRVNPADEFVSAHGLYLFLGAQEPFHKWIRRCKSWVGPDCGKTAYDTGFVLTNDGAREVAIMTKGPWQRLAIRYYRHLVPLAQNRDFNDDAF